MENNESVMELDSSTPSNPAEEPITTMAELLAQEDIDLQLPKRGEIRSGVIASISQTEILVSVGAKSEGIIPTNEVEKIPEDVRSSFEVGQEVSVYVITPEDRHGNLLVSYQRAMEVTDWKLAEELLKSGEPYTSEVEGYNKGGLIVKVGELRGFVPASQVSFSRRLAASGDSPDQRWGEMVNDPITVLIIEVDRSRRRLILSERAASTETRDSIKEKVMNQISVGDEITGRVTSIADFGAFVNLSGADGLVHLSELSWERVKHPTEVLKVGQEVNVKVINIDRERKRIGLSIRQLQKDPWFDKIAALKEGQLIQGTITRLTKFGAFAKLASDTNIEGLIHISELSEKRVEHPREVIHEGEELTLRVIKVDPENRRIGLSLRKVDSSAFADLDWQMAMEDGLEEITSEEDEQPAEQEVEQSSEQPPSEVSEDAAEPSPKEENEESAE